jgi:HAD superfamily phosphatase (TIGR01668 family)
MPLLKPSLVARSVRKISLPSLHKLGVKGIIIDWKNTLVKNNNGKIPPPTRQWLEDAQTLYGMKIIIISNSKPPRRPAHEVLNNIPALFEAGKPGKKAFRTALRILGTKPDETVVIGNSIFTDLLGGNRMGMRTIFVSHLRTKPRIFGTIKQFVVRNLKF